MSTTLSTATIAAASAGRHAGRAAFGGDARPLGLSRHRGVFRNRAQRLGSVFLMTVRTSHIFLVLSAFLAGLVIFLVVFFVASRQLGSGGPGASQLPASDKKH